LALTGNRGKCTGPGVQDLVTEGVKVGVRLGTQIRWANFGLVLFAADFTEDEKMLNRRMMKYWANFAWNG
jgi:hypothetical protein